MEKRVLLLAVILAATLQPASAGQEAEASEISATVARELRRLNETLGAIHALLTEQLETQSLSLLLDRSELAASQAAAIEGELRRARGQRQSLDDEEHHLETRKERLAIQLESGAMEAAESEIEAFEAEIDAGLERIDTRRRDLEAEIAGLLNRLTARQRELRDWQELLDRRLAGE